MSLRYTQEKFLSRAKMVHNNFYDYSLAVYVTSKDKIKIICPQHGIFEQKAGKHLNGDGCKKCALINQPLINKINNRKRKSLFHKDVLPPDNSVVIPLNKDFYALVDEEDFERISTYNWNVAKGRDTFYAQTRVNGKLVVMHRLVMGTQDNMVKIDHRNHNGLDNRKLNLRECSNSQNLMNFISKTGVSRYKGVTLEQNKWRARIMFEGQKISLGMYYSEEDAAKAYDEKAKELFGEFAYLNFPKIII